MAEEGYLLTGDEAARVQHAVEWVELHHPRNPPRRKERKLLPKSCAYYWEFEISGGKPTSGSQVWNSVKIGETTANLTVNYNSTGASVRTSLLGSFPELDADEVTVPDDSGPLPEFLVRIKFVGASAKKAKDDWNPGTNPTVGTNTLNNEAWMKFFGAPN